MGKSPSVPRMRVRRGGRDGPGNVEHPARLRIEVEMHPAWAGRFQGFELFTETPPHFASAISAADYDGDGLLDLYVSTYAQQMPLDEARIAAQLEPGQPGSYRQHERCGNEKDPNRMTHRRATKKRGELQR